MNNFEVTNVSTKGQIVIPTSIREKLNLTPGVKIIVIQDGENILFGTMLIIALFHMVKCKYLET